MTGEPPSLARGVPATVIDVAVALDPTTPVGAPGVVFVAGIVLIAGEGTDQAPQPTAFTGTTLKR